MPQSQRPYTREMDDGRKKIPKSKHAEIRAYYKEHKSQRKTAHHFDVSRKLIIFITQPAKYEALLAKQRKEKHWMKYYDTDKRRYRAKKRAAGLLYNPYAKHIN